MISRIKQMGVKALICQKGFTLIELMVAISIAALTLAMAVPNFYTTIKNNRLTTQINGFVASVNFARSEAVKRVARVTLCKSNDGSTCVNAGNWSQGWIVFLDQNSNAVRENAETVLKVYGESPSNMTLVGASNGMDNYISFVTTGITRRTDGINQTGTITFCDDRPGVFGKMVRINETGRSRIVNDVNCP